MGGSVDAGPGGPEALPLAPREPGQGLPRWAPTAIFAALVLLIGLVVVAQDPGADDPVDADDVALDLEAPAVAGPRDGLESRRHPITVTPAEGLADGQTVTVSGSNFPPNRSLGVVMCSPLGPSPIGGVDNCQISPYTPVASDAQGNFTAEFPVRRYISLSNGVHDCAAPPPEGAAHTCAVAVGAIDDYDESGIIGVHFDPDIPAIPPLSIRVDPDGPVEVGDVLTVTIENAEPGSSWWVDLCGSAPTSEPDEWGHEELGPVCASGGNGYGPCSSPDGCQPTGAEVVADGEGRAIVTVPAPATITHGDAVVDCRDPSSWCELIVGGSSGWAHGHPLLFHGTGLPHSTETTIPGTATDTTMSGPATVTTTATETTFVPTTSVPPTDH